MERSKRAVDKLQFALAIATFACVVQYTNGATTETIRGKMHPAFKNAGQQEGLKIWRIENFEPVPYPEKDYGKFFTGDSYIVLSTKEEKRKKSFTWDIHFWLGNETSQDESGSAAILSVNLDDSLGGGPVQHREVQDHESQQFLNYFKSGVRYVPGGVASGFHHVDVNGPVEKALYQVKGKRNVRVRLVEPKISSMNRGDCFILDSGRDIYVYVGEKSKGVEKVKAISAATSIRDQDHAGRGKIYIIDSSSSVEEVDNFFKELGSGSQNEVPREAPTDDDITFERNLDNIVTLYKVHEAGGQVTSVKVAEKPLSQQMLDTNDCFILDTITSGIFVWIGKKGSTQEKVEALKNGQAFIAEKKYPPWTHIKRVVEGAEPTAFEQYFTDWEEMPYRRGSTGGSPIRRLRSIAKRTHTGHGIGFNPDEAQGGMEIYRIENFELAPVDPNTYGRFFGGDSYVIKYTYFDRYKRDRHIVYFWQGKDSTQDEKSAAALHALRIDNELGARSLQVRVTQGNEPNHFLRLFKGKMVVYLGGHVSGFKHVRDHETYDDDGTRLFEVRGKTSDTLRAVQVPETADSLDSEYAYVLETPSKTYLWIGNECPDALIELVPTVIELVSPDRTVVTVKEGEETEEFWTALGGQIEVPKRPKYGPEFVPKLFHCYVPAPKKLKVEEIFHFTQEDLFEDDVMMLDSGDIVYVWIGNKASEEEKQMSNLMAEEYLDIEPTHRRPEDAVIMTVKQGDEPESFIDLFPEWDHSYWETDSYEELKKKLKESNEAAENEVQ